MAKVDLKRRAKIGEERRRKTRESLVKAAMRLIATRQSLHALTTDNLVQEAGVSRGTFYNHFDSINEVLEGIAVHITQDINLSITTEYQDEESGAIRLAYSMSRFFARAEEDKVWASVLLTLMLEAKMIDDETRAYFQSDLERGRNSGYFTIVDDVVATIIVSGIVTACLNAIVNDSLTKVQQTALLQSMLQGLGMTKAASKKAVWNAQKLADTANTVASAAL